jgi:hypothetical protein
MKKGAAQAKFGAAFFVVIFQKRYKYDIIFLGRL